jgi:PIN domain nuclease of toxin-antitoxin system
MRTGQTVQRYQLKISLESDYAALLPVGAPETDLVDVLCDVSDQLGAAARAAAAVAVTQRQMSTAELANVTGNLLDSAFETGDLETVYQALNSAGALKKAPAAANCTLDCASLGRAECDVDWSLLPVSPFDVGSHPE